MKFFSSKRSRLALVLATLFVIYLFNFVPIYSSIINSRSLGRQVADYALNIIIFTACFYLIISFLTYLYSVVFNKKS
jgi:exosortase/archaeosortase family protein